MILGGAAKWADGAVGRENCYAAVKRRCEAMSTPDMAVFANWTVLVPRGTMLRRLVGTQNWGCDSPRDVTLLPSPINDRHTILLGPSQSMSASDRAR